MSGRSGSAASARAGRSGSARARDRQQEWSDDDGDLRSARKKAKAGVRGGGAGEGSEGNAAPRKGAVSIPEVREREGRPCARGDGGGAVDEAGGAPKAAARKRAKSAGRSEKAFNSVQDVDEEIARLKKPPRELKKGDFQEEFGLPNEGDNPHHFRRNTVQAESLRKLFGKPYGDGGRSGFNWQNCEVQEVVDRVKYLHPILYQHGEDETPNLITVRFAEGVTLEYEEGGGRVNWCAFGEETNKRQRSRYQLDRSKLDELRKKVAESRTLEGKGRIDVRGLEWRGIKVEHGSRVKMEQGVDGGELGRGKPGARSNSEQTLRSGGRIRRGEGDGGLESARESGICLQEDINAGGRGAVLSKGVAAERLQVVEGLMAALHLELKHKRELKKKAGGRLDSALWRSKQSEWSVETLKKQEEQKAALINTLEEQGADVYKEKIKMEGIQEQLADEDVKVAAAKEELKLAEEEIQALTRGLETGQVQFDALAAEKFLLKQGRSASNFCPQPMVYARGEPTTVEIGDTDESQFIKITTCCLCDFPFPQNDIVVSSCKHLYHPYCASVLYVRSCKCVAVGCGELSHPEWHRSFGWGEPSPELLEREMVLGSAEERRRLLQERTNEAKAKAPSDGKFT